MRRCPFDLRADFLYIKVIKHADFKFNVEISSWHFFQCVIRCHIEYNIFISTSKLMQSMNYISLERARWVLLNYWDFKSMKMCNKNFYCWILFWIFQIFDLKANSLWIKVLIWVDFEFEVKIPFWHVFQDVILNITSLSQYQNWFHLQVIYHWKELIELYPIMWHLLSSN